MYNFKTYVKIDEKGTSKLHEISKQNVIYFEENKILEVSGMSKKQLSLYILRHKEISKIKKGKINLISINILDHVFKNIKRLNNKIIKNYEQKMNKGN